MKVQNLLIPLLVFVTVGCAPSEEAVQTAIAQTKIALPTAADLLTNTPTLQPTFTPVLTATFNINGLNLGIQIQDILDLFSNKYGFSFTPLENKNMFAFFIWGRDLNEEEAQFIGKDRFDSTIHFIARQDYLVFASYSQDLSKLQDISSPSIADFGRIILSNATFDEIFQPQMKGDNSRLCIGNVFLFRSISHETETISIDIAMKSDLSDFVLSTCNESK